MSKLKLLIIYTKMVVGGSTTSLLSILDNLDYSRYEVKLLLLDDTGDLQHLINPNVSVAVTPRPSKIKRLLNPSSWTSFFKAEKYYRQHKNKLLKAQINSAYLASSMPVLNEFYDVAISFLEFWPQRYLANNVKAGKKISWIHIDPYEAGLNPDFSKKYLSLVDTIVLVSNSCKDNFDRLFPELANKSEVVENILDSRIIRKLSQEETEISVDKKKINLVTVCRVNLASKGLDRVISAMKKLKDDCIDIESKMDWYIIGDGPDFISFTEMVKDAGLSNIHMLGKQLNPYKYERMMDYFLLPSRYEGKPMAVTEAQMLGLVPIVCNYSSASEQINNGSDGIIVPNDDGSIINPLMSILNDEYDYSDLRQSVESKDYSNTHVMDEIYELMK